MPISFYIVAAIATITFLLIVYQGVNRILYISKVEVNKATKLAILEQERLEHFAKFEHFLNRYEILVQEVETLKSKEAENEKLQTAMYKAFLNQYYDKISKATAPSVMYGGSYGLIHTGNITGASIKYKTTSIREINPEYQNQN